MDVSFISIRLILPALYACLREGALAVSLVKPQFEAGRNKVGKNGVVRDSAVHSSVLCEAARFAMETGFGVKAVDFSPITGPKGNIEFLLVLQKGEENSMEWEQVESCIQHVVAEAHESLY